MKKTLLKLFALALALHSVLYIGVSAQGGQGWYIQKRGNSTPGFPADAEYLSANSCYFIDKSSADAGVKVIYLTFDAGYENGNIAKILDTLKEKEVPAAFFILSNLIKKNADLVTRMFKEGHTVCNHTKNHKNMTKLTAEEMKSNLEELEVTCYETTGYRMAKYFRYPEGYYSKECVKNASAFGYKTFFWSMAYADWDNANQPSRERAIQALTTTTHPGAIVLLHPTSKTNANILCEMIDTWRDMGYSFGTLDELVKNN